MTRRSKSSLTTTPGDIARHRGSEKPFDMRKPKRVRFVDNEMDGVPVYASSGRREAAESPRSGAPKTSEYAYFRKVKNGCVHCHSSSLPKENEQLKSSKINNLITETTNDFGTHKPSRKDLKFSVSGERAGPSDHNLFPSPRVSKYDEPDQRKLTDKGEKRSSMLFENVTPVGQSLFSSPLYKASENSGPENEHSEKGIFSAKRDRLRQWAADTLFSEVEKPHPKGFDLVSTLMSRLFPKDNEDNDSSKQNADNNNKSLAFHESNNLEKGLHLSHQRDVDMDIPKLSSDRSSEIILSDWDNFVSRFPFSNYATKSHAQDVLDSKSHLYRNAHTQNDFSFCLPFERYRSADSFHFKVLDEFNSVTERAREDPVRPLLKWDFGFGNNRVDSSTSNRNATKNACAELATSWDVDQQRIMDNVLYSKGLCSSFSNYYLEFDSLPNNCSTGYSTQDFGPNFEDVKCALTEPGQFSLALPCSPKCITLTEDRNEENILSNRNVIFSYRDQHWLKDNVLDDNFQTDFWHKCLSASDFSAEDYPIFHAWQFKEAHGEPFTTPFSEGAFYGNFLSSNLHSSIDTRINRPLLLGHVSRDRYDQEIYFDDDDDNNKLEYI